MTEVVLHNGATQEVGRYLVLTSASPTPWSNIATCPIGPLPPGMTISVRVTVAAEGGSVLVSLADSSGSKILCAEKPVAPGEVVALELTAASDGVGAVLIRCSDEAHAAPRVTIKGIDQALIDTPYSNLRVDDRPHPPTPISEPTQPSSARSIDKLIALTHTSRAWNLATCTREFLARRYAGDRSLPPFETLGRAGSKSYAGGLSILRVIVNGSGTHLHLLGHVASDDKIQAANVVGRHLVMCLEDHLLVLDWGAADMRAEAVVRHSLRGEPRRIDDPWFAGLHTVFEVDERTALVSASGPDAALWVDLDRGRVTRRWRLPEDQYGKNYDLGPSDSVFDHYIHNDLQLGHLNCAFPLGTSAALISTLGQGDIGVVHADGSFTRIHHGSIGCHGVRLARDGSVYFADSCSGQLRLLRPKIGDEKWAWAESTWSTPSRWLHDVLEVGEGIYMLALGDRNSIKLVDVNAGSELGTWCFDGLGANVQFLTDLEKGSRTSSGADAVLKALHFR